MAIQLIGGTSGIVADVDTTFKAARTTLRSLEAINWNRIGGTSGLLTGVAAAGPVFSFRNTGANPMLVDLAQVGFVTTTAFTTAQGLQYQLIRANSFSASDTGGTALYVAGANKLRNSFTTIASAPDIRIASTAALTAGTRTLEASPLAVVNGSSTAVATGLTIQDLFRSMPGEYPLVLAQNEGFIIANGQAMGAAGVINLQVNIRFAEVTSF